MQHLLFNRSTRDVDWRDDVWPDKEPQYDVLVRPSEFSIRRRGPSDLTRFSKVVFTLGEFKLIFMIQL